MRRHARAVTRGIVIGLLSLAAFIVGAVSSQEPYNPAVSGYMLVKCGTPVGVAVVDSDGNQTVFDGSVQLTNEDIALIERVPETERHIWILECIKTDAKYQPRNIA